VPDDSSNASDDRSFQVEYTLARSFGENLRNWRRRHGLTQEAFAERLDLSVRYSRGLERGEHNLSMKRVEEIAYELDEDPAELLLGHRWDPQEQQGSS